MNFRYEKKNSKFIEMVNFKKGKGILKKEIYYLIKKILKVHIWNF